MLIDSHCHLELFARRGDLDAVLNEASAAGVNRMIAVGTDSSDWGLYRELSAKYPGKIYHSVGLHPCHVNERWPEELAELERILASGDGTPPIAIGEMGLDFFHLPKKDLVQREALMQLQQQAFEAQLELANRFRLPVIIHSRDAFDACVRTIDLAGAQWDRMVFHCFSEGKAQIDRINLRGGRGSFTGIVTYGNSGAMQLREAMLEQGVERLMIETDCPYLAPQPHKGAENRPAMLRLTLNAIANHFEMQVDELEERVRANTMEFFKLKV
jgi:TatD DNase family protein